MCANVDAITKNSPAISRLISRIRSRCSMYFSATSAIGMSKMSSSSSLMRWSNRSNGPSKLDSATRNGAAVRPSVDGLFEPSKFKCIGTTVLLGRSTCGLPMRRGDAQLFDVQTLGRSNGAAHLGDDRCGEGSGAAGAVLQNPLDAHRILHQLLALATSRVERAVEEV